MDASSSPIRRTRPCMALLGICTALLGGCAHQRQLPHHELWIPTQANANVILEGRELWIDVELAGYTRQSLESYSDYEAQNDEALDPE